MKKVFILGVLGLFTHPVFAQSAIDTGTHSVELGEVVVRSQKPDKMKNKVRSQNVYIVLNPAQNSQSDTTITRWFATKFSQPEQDPISPYSVEVKLQPYDRSMFDIKLLIYQPNSNDTIHKEFLIDGSKIDRQGKLRVSLFEADITLQPTEFYIGYGFVSKQIKEPFSYKMYATNKGEGAIISFAQDGVKIISDPHIPYVFPFKMTYRKY